MRLATLLLALTAATSLPPPTRFAPELMGASDSSPAFAPDGRSVVFIRFEGDGVALMASHREGAGWSAPRPALSGHERDFDAAMAPDGSYMVFASSRPATAGGKPLDAVMGGALRVGKGMNLWRVERRGDGWGEPVRLPDAVNRCTRTFAPGVAGDGSVYFIGCDADDKLQLMRSAYQGGQYEAAERVAIGDAATVIRDPAILPDGSAMVFSMRKDPSKVMRLAISFHGKDGWSEPHDLGDSVNAGTHAMAPQWGCDHRTIYFSSDRAGGSGAPGSDATWQVSLASLLAAHGVHPPSTCAAS